MDTVILVLVLVLAVIYFIPTLIAFLRDHHNVNAIALLNLFLGWTFIGWVISLAWKIRER